MRNIVTMIAALVLLQWLCQLCVAFEPDRSGFNCLESMTVPEYVGVIWQARITGTAKVTVTLDQNATASLIQVDSPHASLSNWLKWWFGNEVSFRRACRGKTVDFELNYALEGEKRETPDNQVVIKYPNGFQITAHPPILHPTIN